MKRILKITFSILLVFGVLLLASCGLSEEERSLREIKAVWAEIVSGEAEFEYISLYQGAHGSVVELAIREPENIRKCLEIYKKIDVDSFAPGKSDDWVAGWEILMPSCLFVFERNDTAAVVFAVTVDEDGRAHFFWETKDKVYYAHSEDCGLTRSDLACLRRWVSQKGDDYEKVLQKNNFYDDCDLYVHIV